MHKINIFKVMHKCIIISNNYYNIMHKYYQSMYIVYRQIGNIEHTDSELHKIKNYIENICLKIRSIKTTLKNKELINDYRLQ